MHLEIHSRQDFWSGIMFVGFGVVFSRIAIEYDMGRLSAMGPGWFPFALGSLLTVIGGSLVVTAIRWNAHKRSAASALYEMGEDELPPVGWRGLSLVLTAIAVFAAGLPHLGVLLAVFIMVIIAGTASTELRTVELLMTAIALSALCYGLFVRGLGVPLPVWPTFVIGG
ncbi:tripartite tricarboxylate transporter TctB family protein [Paracoccus onubensis]|uniref:Tripartite tricarboxylate transporter TctB family protein n=1 Tax=Paracoccus onubensis TaxID=1675788 RepID=A0A418SN26_9RHOB|nr:tripartite tricarboxylate transporter TctB family protein [Paracoccus onubensis]RJE82366.1 tripartite tricarboxylate transporter TctB family protein [Paracoccus onubensis]